MKKIFALILVLAMLVPLGLVPAANAEEVTAQPFYTLGWSDFDESKFPYLDGLVNTTFSMSGSTPAISYGDVSVVYREDGVDDARVTRFAQALKKTMDARPDGLRYWHLWNPRSILKPSVENTIYLDAGVKQLKALVTPIMAKYKEIGGKLDGIVIDTEYFGLSAYYIYTPNEWNANDSTHYPLVYHDIVNDPRYATEVRPLLEERGFIFYENPTDYTPEIYSIDKDAGSKYKQSQNIWDTVMRNRLCMYLNDWAYEPLKTYFPEATMSDYDSTDRNAWMKIVGASENGEILTGGNAIKAGNVSCYEFYFTRPGADFYQALKKYTAYNDAIYEASAFNSFLFDANYAKAMYASTDTKLFAPWIAHYNYKRFPNMDMTGSISNTVYYSEQILHLGMLNPEPFLAYMWTGDILGEDKKPSKEMYEDCATVVNQLMAELTKVAGYSDRKAIEIAPYWNSEFVLSGMYANGRNIWRITPNIDKVSLENFKVEGTDPTFSAKGQTITFPGGKIIEDGTVNHVGTCGYWVETPADVTPIIVNDANRFANYPSLVYDFEDVAEGAYDYNNHEPLTAWEFTWKKGASTSIEKIGDNKVLVMKGNAELRSAKLPANITAGDSYAEDQAWSVTVTIPEGLADDAEITLLNYTGMSPKPKDGGFKISGGKVYYSTIGTDEEGKTVQEYVEFCDITPGTYVFERVVDFNDAEAFYCNYNIYNTDGTNVASSKKIAISVFGSISTINFATKNIGDKAVHLDDYKIILVGTTTDFEIYDAPTGIPVDKEAMDTLRDRDTAYRLSWLNATSKEETATVMAAFYQGEALVEEKVLKEIKMAPGYDGVETGVVELADGQTVKVYLKTSITEGGDRAKGGLSIGIIAVAVAAVVVIAAVIVALVVTKSPAPKAQPAETTEEVPEEKPEEE